MGGKITLGYKVSEDGYWEIDEEGSKLVRLIFDMYISGEYSLTGLGKELKSRGYFKKPICYQYKSRNVSFVEKILFIEV